MAGSRRAFLDDAKVDVRQLLKEIFKVFVWIYLVDFSGLENAVSSSTGVGTFRAVAE